MGPSVARGLGQGPGVSQLACGLLQSQETVITDTCFPQPDDGCVGGSRGKHRSEQLGLEQGQGEACSLCAQLGVGKVLPMSHPQLLMRGWGGPWESGVT